MNLCKEQVYCNGVFLYLEYMINQNIRFFTGKNMYAFVKDKLKI